MADKDLATERIRTYLAKHGGSVHDAGGRGLTDEMAKAIGEDRPAALSALLGQMESDGVITREMRGLRTYRIALAAADGPGQTASESAPYPGNGIDGRAALRGAQRVSVREPRAGDPATLEQPRSGGAAAVSLREALSRKSAAGTVAGATVADEPAELDDDVLDPPSGRTVSLRDALSRQSPPRATAVAPPAVRPAGRLIPEPDIAHAPSEWPASRTVSLREALAAPGIPGAPPTEAPTRPGGQFASLRDTSPLAPFADAGPWDHDGDDALAQRAAKGSARADRARRPRHHLSVPVPEVTTPPSTTMVTAVSVAVAGLVLVAVITVLVARSNHHVPTPGTVFSSTDACQVVTADLATAAFGKDAGVPHFVLGSCVYDDGVQQLVVEVARANARVMFDGSRTSSAQDLPGLGDAAYYADGRVRVLKGSSLMQVAFVPVPADATKPNPKLLALANAAAAHL